MESTDRMSMVSTSSSFGVPPNCRLERFHAVVVFRSSPLHLLLVHGILQSSQAVGVSLKSGSYCAVIIYRLKSGFVVGCMAPYLVDCNLRFKFWCSALKLRILLKVVCFESPVVDIPHAPAKLFV